jgi:beta-glucuronidase
MLPPLRNAFRDWIDLEGAWDFAIDPQDRGEAEGWTAGPPPMALVAVPGSFNEQLEARGLLDYAGAAWLARTVEVPAHFAGRALHLYFGSADLRADVWVDGRHAGHHDQPFLPFEVPLDPAAAGRALRIVIRLDARLRHDDPLMGITREDYVREGRPKDEIFPAVRFDFHPYCGLHRQVALCARPPGGIADLVLDADRLPDGRGRLQVRLSGGDGGDALRLVLRDPLGAAVAEAAPDLVAARRGAVLEVPDCRAWRPDDPALYRLEATLLRRGVPVDAAERRTGFRRIEVRGDRLLLNDEPLYLRGFGMHEDFPALGKGQALAVTVRDLELLRWTGANCLRTAHYPYAEETLDLADRLGLLVIGEAACVNLDLRHDGAALRERHARAVTRMIARDRHHPCIIAWSLANEPGYLGEAAYRERGGDYFATIAAAARAADATRPLMVANVEYAGREDPAFAHCDLVAVNRYYGWYTMPGQVERAAARLGEELDFLLARYGKPVLLSEFGADAVAGQHAIGDRLFTEEYQAHLLEAMIDEVERRAGCCGALVWNFADFRTAQHHRRVVHNLKGVFTRTREPKRAAFALRARWQRH